MVSQKEGLTFLSRMERLAFIKQRYKRLVLDSRGDAELAPIADIADDDEDDMEEPLVEVVVSDFDYDDN